MTELPVPRQEMPKMNVTNRVSEKFKAVVDEAEEILSACGWSGYAFNRSPDDMDYLRLRTQAMNLVRRVCGAESDHYLELRRLAETPGSANNSNFLAHCVGIIKAAQHDFENGLLFDMRALVVAEVLGDFIEQAEALIREGYHIPAASLAGAVLEDTLRKPCLKHGVALPDTTKIDRLNSDLAKAGVYDKLVQKRITALADIRNNADHGRFDKFAADDVEDMVKWLRRFTADYLS
jgi:hypothetical protein